MKKKEKMIFAMFSGMLFILLIVLLRFADVEQIGPEGTSIGLSVINQSVFNLTGVNMIWYDITDWLGVVALLTAFVFAMTGFIQMIKRKSFLKVDREIITLGGLYTAVIGLYVLFEKVIVNYRPIIMPDSIHPEASFPSSHTMLVCVIMGSEILLLPKYVRDQAVRRILSLICALIIGITVIGRFIAGVHWFTDIIGGILISAALLALFSAIIGDSINTRK